MIAAAAPCCFHFHGRFVVSGTNEAIPDCPFVEFTFRVVEF
jgi:hypothetical protein